jgi:hypothetical protein
MKLRYVLLSFGISVLGISNFVSCMANPLSKEDKKSFDNLIDVSFTKGSLATKARKEKRITDLQQLAALMIEKFVVKIETAGLKEGEYDTKAVLENLNSLIRAGHAKAELVSASRYATQEFLTKYEELRNNAFRTNINAFNVKLEQNYIAKWESQLGRKITLLEFLNRLQSVPAKDREQLKTVLPDEGQTNACFIRSFAEFNKYYSQVINAIMAVSKLTHLQVPQAPITLDFFKGKQEFETCPICFQELYKEEHVQTPCHHWFHKNCILDWLKKNSTCPVCRREITKESLK